MQKQLKKQEILHSSTQQIPSITKSIQTITHPQSTSLPSTTLSTQTLFSHYFLIHDFLFRLVKSPARNGKYFDLQMQVNQGMRNATKVGGKMGEIGMFGGLILYCVKGKSFKLRFLYGFLFIYWIEHFYTLGSYIGVLMRMPSLYKKTGEYFLNSSSIPYSENYFLKLTQQLTLHQNKQYQDTQQILNCVFGQQIIEQKNYVSNDYFLKNKDKYFCEQQGTKLQKPNLKLKYMDCFLTRYVYYSFQRWAKKRLIKYGLMEGDL